MEAALDKESFIAAFKLAGYRTMKLSFHNHNERWRISLYPIQSSLYINLKSEHDYKRRPIITLESGNDIIDVYRDYQEAYTQINKYIKGITNVD